MGMRIIPVSVAFFTIITALKIPIERADEDNTENTTVINDHEPSDKPIYYLSNEDNVDSYLVPPNPHRTAEILSDAIATPATFLLPPSDDKHIDYYKSTESGAQTDWYPISPAASSIPRGLLPPRQSKVLPVNINNQSEPIFDTYRTGKVLRNEKNVPVPSTNLEPPAENAPNDYVAIISDTGIDLPYGNERLNPHQQEGYPVWGPRASQNQPVVRIPVSYSGRPHKNPTKLYPKKYAGEFKPVPIPLAQFADESFSDVPKAKPIKTFNPNYNYENDYRSPSEEKNIYQYEEAQKKRKLKGEIEDAQVQDVHVELSPSEQETSATNYRVPTRNVYPVPLRQAPPQAPAKLQNPPPADGERTEFRMHGMKGPHSYQFGFDTGKGKNRQFRFEERDNDGHVRGHYGYVDKHGKLRVVNYDADPEHGFRADAPVDSE